MTTTTETTTRERLEKMTDAELAAEIQKQLAAIVKLLPQLAKGVPT